LPKARIKLPSLVITRPIHLMGAEGTVLEISEGSITVDLARGCSPPNGEEISELFGKFNVEKRLNFGFNRVILTELKIQLTNPVKNSTTIDTWSGLGDTHSGNSKGSRNLKVGSHPELSTNEKNSVERNRS
jgi:hypothetical protein